MEDPVIVPESGNSYERTNIEAWLCTSMSVAVSFLTECIFKVPASRFTSGKLHSSLTREL